MILDLRVRRGAQAIVSGQLTVRRNLEVSSASQLVFNNGTVDLTNRLQVSGGSELILGVPIKAAIADLTGTSTLTQIPTTGSALFRVDINASTLNIDGTSKMMYQRVDFRCRTERESVSVGRDDFGISIGEQWL
jgi:hypothetical protein